MKKIKKSLINLWKDESGQGTAEYVLILVGVLAVAMIFKDRIKDIVGSKMNDLKTKIGGFTAN